MTTVYLFTSPTCAPCKAFAPIFEKMSREYKQARFEIVDSTTQTELAEQFNIRSCPTVVIQVMDKIINVHPVSSSVLRTTLNQIGVK